MGLFALPILVSLYFVMFEEASTFESFETFNFTFVNNFETLLRQVDLVIIAAKLSASIVIKLPIFFPNFSEKFLAKPFNK